MKLEAKYIVKYLYSNIMLMLMICWVCMVLSTSLAWAAVAPGDENYAGNSCSVEGLSDKQYDESKCETDSKCDASSSCVDAAPIGSVNRVSDPFGYRIHPITGKPTGHKGVDYATTAGTPIYAGADGVITDMRYQYNAAKGTGYGNLIKLKADSPAGTTMLYAHMACFASGVGIGTHVKKGQIIGFVGNTGGSTGAHLHYEVQKNGVAVDPYGDEASSVVCTPDEQIAAMHQNAVDGGNGTANGGGYNTGAGGIDVGSGGGNKGNSRPNIQEQTGVVGNIDSPANDGHNDKDLKPAYFAIYSGRLSLLQVILLRPLLKL